MFFSSLMGIAVVREFCAIIIATKAEGVLQENEGSKTRKDYVYVSLYVAFLTPSFLKGKKSILVGWCGVWSHQRPLSAESKVHKLNFQKI